MLSRRPLDERVALLRRFAGQLGLAKLLDGKVLLEPNVRILVHDGEMGPIVDEIKIHNLVVNSGLAHHRDLIGYPSTQIPSFAATPLYFAIGTDATAAAGSQTALLAEVLREQISRRYPPSAYAIDYYYYLSTSSANGYTLAETGLFSLASGGEAWARATHTAVAKTAAISLSYRWTWTYGAI